MQQAQGWPCRGAKHASCAPPRVQRLDDIAATFEYATDNTEELVKTCMTTLSSKM